MRITRRAFTQAGVGAGVLAAGGLRAQEALITRRIPGMTKVRHVEDNMQAGTGRMPDAAQRRQQEAFFDAL